MSTEHVPVERPPAGQVTPIARGRDGFGAGFADPVHGAQAWFRALMDAMARPGSLPDDLSGNSGAGSPPPAAPSPLSPATAALLLTLCDADTPLWLSPTLAGVAEVVTWLRFHTGAPLVAWASEAMFVVAHDAAECPPLEALAQGSDVYPDTSATLLLGVSALALDSAPDSPPAAGPGRDGGPDAGARADDGESLVLEGPGIARRTTLRVRGLPGGFVEAWARNHARFPCGVDIVLLAPETFACLPRSVRVASRPSAEGR